MQEVPSLFLAPTDNNILSLCFFMKNVSLTPPPPPPVGSKSMYIPLALGNAETKRDNDWQLNSNITCENYLQFNQERSTILSLSICY